MCTTSSLSIHMLMGIYVVFMPWLLGILLPWRQGCMQLFELCTVLNRSAESGILTKRFSVFTTDYHTGCWCAINNFYYVETCSLNTYFGKSFFLIMNRCWILLNAFFCSYWDDHVVFYLSWCGGSHWWICMCWTILVN